MGERGRRTLSARAAGPLVREARRALRAVLRHLTAERRTVRQGLVALAISTAVGILAGVALGSIDGLLRRVPGLLVLVPAAIGMRGAIFGALGSRLGTGMLTGQYERTLRRGSFTQTNVEAAALLTLVSSVLAALFARGSAAVLSLGSIPLLDLTIVSTAGGVVASTFILGGVLGLAASAERRNWDMDAIGSPLITAVGDVVTLPALVLATLLLANRFVAEALGVAALLAAGAAVHRGLLRAAPQTRRIVAQSIPVLAVAAFLDILAGTVLQTRLDALNPALLVLVPPFLACCGSLGGMLSARLASDLHLGMLTPRLVPQRYVGLETSIVVVLAVPAFAAVGALADVAARLAGFASPGALQMAGAALIGGAFATVLLSAVAYAAAAATYQLGLDPDNYGVPLVTATMDLLGIVCLVTAISLVA